MARIPVNRKLQFAGLRSSTDHMKPVDSNENGYLAVIRARVHTENSIRGNSRRAGPGRTGGGTRLGGVGMSGQIVCASFLLGRRVANLQPSRVGHPPATRRTAGFRRPACIGDAARRAGESRSRALPIFARLGVALAHSDSAIDAYAIHGSTRSSLSESGAGGLR